MDLEALVTDELREAMTALRARVVRGRGLVARPPHATVGDPPARRRRGERQRSRGDGPIDAIFRAINAATGIEPTLRDFRVGAVTGGRTRSAR